MKTQIIEGISISLPDNANVKEVIKRDYFYVLFGMADLKSPELARNIWKFSQDGELIWKIEPIKKGLLEPYSAIEFRDEDLIVYNQMGIECIVEQTSGKLLPPKSPQGRPW